MFVNQGYLNFCLFIFTITFLSSNALFCSNLTATVDKDTPCFLEEPTDNPVLLRTSGSSLVLPCHVARSKRATVEWWYSDLQRLVNFKIYPVHPRVRPTVLRFITSLTPQLKHLNETDIVDASILLRQVNIDDSGIYRCVIRTEVADPIDTEETIVLNGESDVETLDYQVELTGPRLCQANPGAWQCFSLMRTSSPTVLDAYHTAFLQCVVKSQNRPVHVFWVVGDATTNSILITHHLSINKHRGDRLRRIFPLSPVDYSIELSVNRTLPQRSYSCVIKGATDTETTLFTYIVRNIHLEAVDGKVLNRTNHGEILNAPANATQLLVEDNEVSNDAENLSGENSHEYDGKEETTTAAL